MNLDLAYEFERLGHETVFVLRRPGGELFATANENFETVVLNVDRARDLVLPLVQYLRHSKPEVLLAGMWPLTVIAPIAAKLANRGTRVVISEHGVISSQYASRGRLHHALMRLSVAIGYRLTSACVGVSKGVASDIARLAWLPESAVRVIHNPVRDAGSETLAESMSAEPFWGSQPGKRIVTVGRFKEVKNHALLLRAFAQLLRSTSATLMLVGGGELEGRLRQLAIDLRVAERVVFAGFQENPAPFYASADLFVLTSDREGFGNVIVEAMAQGTPVVSTDCPFGPAEILEGGRWGRLVPVGDEVALAKAMCKVLKAPADESALRRRAADFAPDKIAERYLETLFPK